MQKFTHYTRTALNVLTFSLSGVAMGALGVFAFLSLFISGPLLLQTSKPGELVQAPIAHAAAGSGELHGFAWSGYDNPNGLSASTCATPCAGLGWISFNSTDLSGVTQPYKVTYDASLTGEVPFDAGSYAAYGWDSATSPLKGGWINFAPTSPSYPSYCGTAITQTKTECKPAYISTVFNNISGWARDCSVFVSGCTGTTKSASETGGWDGWIYLGETYTDPDGNGDMTLDGMSCGIGCGVKISGSQLTGNAWGGKANFGWINFNPDNIAGNSNGVTLTTNGPRPPRFIGGYSPDTTLGQDSAHPISIQRGISTGFIVSLTPSQVDGSWLDQSIPSSLPIQIDIDWDTNSTSDPALCLPSCGSNPVTNYYQVGNPPSGNTSIGPNYYTWPTLGPTTITVTAKNTNGFTATRTYYVNVTPPPPTITSFNVSTGYTIPDTQTVGILQTGAAGNVTITWQTLNTSACQLTRTNPNSTLSTALNNTTGLSNSGTIPGAPATVYTLTCQGLTGYIGPDATQSIPITVNTSCGNHVDDETTNGKIGYNFCDYATGPNNYCTDNNPPTRTVTAGDPGCMNPEAGSIPYEAGEASCGNNICDVKAGENPFTCSVDCRQAFQEQ
jgi:hypothetical protein